MSPFNSLCDTSYNHIHVTTPWPTLKLYIYWYILDPPMEPIPTPTLPFSHVTLTTRVLVRVIVSWIRVTDDMHTIRDMITRADLDLRQMILYMTDTGTKKKMCHGVPYFCTSKDCKLHTWNSHTWNSSQDTHENNNPSDTNEIERNWPSCLLWRDKVRTTENSYIWVSV